MHPDELLGAFWRDGLALAEAAEAAGHDAPVASCPGWTVDELVWHTGEVHWFWASVVEGRWEDPSEYEEPERPASDDLLSWYRAGVDRTLAILRAAHPAAAVWTWAPRGGTVGWIIRRMAQETAVHRWDAEAAAGRSWSIDAELASDGIDEFLEHFTDRAADGAAPLGGTAHLHCTDVDGEWLVAEPERGGRLEIRREHAKGDVAVRGPASDLLLALWRRRPLEGLEVLGDRSVADHLLARTDLS